MVRDKTLLRRQVNTKRVTLLDSRTFYARYERVSRRNLPANAPKKRARTIAPRQQRKQKQRGSGFFSSAFKLGSRLLKPSNIIKGIDISSKVHNSALGKKIIEKGIKPTTEISSAGVKRIKNNKIKKSIRMRSGELYY